MERLVTIVYNMKHFIFFKWKFCCWLAVMAQEPLITLTDPIYLDLVPGQLLVRWQSCMEM